MIKTYFFSIKKISVIFFLLLTFSFDITYAYEKKILKINDEEIFTLIAGQGNNTPIIMIHGLGMSSQFWENNIDQLAKDRKVYAIDLPGFGFSENNRKDYSVVYYVNLLNEILLSLNMPKVILIGNSLGGSISILYAIQNPDQVEKLILVNSDGGKVNKNSILNTLSIPIIGDLIFIMRDKSMIRKNLKRDVFYNSNFVTDELVSAVAHGSRDVFLLLLRNSKNIIELLPKIRCRTLIIWGEKDIIYPLENAHVFNEKIPKSELVIFSETRTCPQIEKSNNFNDIVLQFIQ
ncbi:alpha/beta hydrolase [Candidatus Poribacteria bacterium]|nr:alpha/beta hydrolase [Candidatus Poribacteria bacterium]